MKELNISIDLSQILAENDDEVELVPYLVKLELHRHGIPVIINPVDVRDPDFIVEEGYLSYEMDVESMIMKFTYKETNHENTERAA